MTYIRIGPKGRAAPAVVGSSTKPALNNLLAGLASQGWISRPTVGGVQTASHKINWGGNQVFAHGVNLAWINRANDYGGGPSGGGLSSTSGQAALDTWFAAAQNAGMRVVRTFMFPDATRLTVDGSNNPTGWTANVFTDMDAALAKAAQYHLLLKFELFESPTYLPYASSTTSWPWIDTSAGRAALVSTIKQMVDRYASSTHIFAWSLGNEWDNKMTAPGAASTSTLVSYDNMRTLIGQFMTMVHASTPILGQCSQGGIGAQFVNLPGGPSAQMDFYEAHFYANVNSATSNPYNITLTGRDYAWAVSTFGYDKPVIIGEIMADGQIVYTVTASPSPSASGFTATGLAGTTTPFTTGSNPGSGSRLGDNYGNLLNYWLRFTSNTTTVALRNQQRLVASNTTSAVTLVSAFGTAPVSGDTFQLNPAQAMYQDLYDKGYAGVWGWSASPGAADLMRIDWAAATAFASGKSDIGPVV